jgi:hypothetical protein
LIIFFVLNLMFSCTPTRIIKPLRKKETAIGGSFGGPLIKFSGAVIPIPYITLNGGHGVSDKVTLTGAAHVTSAVFGVAQIETGALISLWQKDSMKQGISLHANLNTAFNQKDLRLWPQTDLNYFKHLTQKAFLYAGVSCWFEPDLNGPHNTRIDNFIIPSIQFGYMMNQKSWMFQFEGKVIAPNENNKFVAVDYVTPLGKAGAFGVYFTAAKRFGK